MTQIKSDLEREISEARRTISSDGYPMSIGELTNMYRDGELKIRPEFQRFFRWSDVQKSRLVESLILGIPLPSIFVAQTETGIWELVDGLQRISTILELQGELKDAEGDLLPPLKLQGTKYLPSLDGKIWSDNKRDHSLSEAQRLDIKRSKIDIKIIKRESSAQTKFDLFQRLNSYGSTLNSQEMRSALLVAASPDFFAWIERLSREPNFVACTGLSDKLIEERYDLELVIRFLVLHNWSANALTLSALRDLPSILDDRSVELAQKYPQGNKRLQDIFIATFKHINNNGGEDVFRRWFVSQNLFKGSFLNTSFEVFALGLGFRIANNLPYRSDLIKAVKQLWARPSMQKGFATGRSTEARLIEFIPLGRELTK
ncbi:DUF262 domain-containing protein [Rhizobium pusense]|uniref:DUF262 domain-containing protein n=1 Tax=Agrobacterium pusense TaxID=648995 RepID=UPI00244AB8DF|nr:DUF262 domain-containing protein [Agrobacterium pusense]MDH1269868.1 DUF262 domain-containing protein [Agrobacterium pusense]